MSETLAIENPTDSITYEYSTVRVDRDFESLYRDTYRSFGWIVEGYGATLPKVNTVTLKIKRPRRIKNRPQVVELQRQAEHALADIVSLEKSKRTAAVGTSLGVGIAGSAFLAGSVFAITADNWGPGIVLGTVGLLFWLAGWVVYGKVKNRRTTKVLPEIDQRYGIVYEASEKAAHLLA